MAGWDHLGLDSTNVRAVKLLGDSLYAATDSGLYVLPLSDQSSGWVHLGLGGIKITALLVLNPDTIFAGTDSGDVSIYRTTNGGQEWILFENGYGGGSFYPVFSFESLQGNMNIIFATGYAVTARSSDCGESWQVVFGGNGPDDWYPIAVKVWFVKADPNTPDIIWTGGETAILSARLAKSTNGGDDWADVDLPYIGDNACHDVAVVHGNSDLLYASAEGKVYESDDGGDSWSTILTNSLYLYIIESDSLRQDILYTSGGQKDNPLTIWTSENGGADWSSVSDSTHEDNWAWDMILVSRENHNILYLGTKYGVYRYTDILDYVCGDADGSESVDIDDVVFLIACIFAGGPEPYPIEVGDADCSGDIDIDDVVYLIAYIFSGGSEPCSDCRQ